MPTQPRSSIKSERPVTSSSPRRHLMCGAAVVFLLSLSATATLAASAAEERIAARLKNIELCNGTDRSSPEPQIRGCTALIETPRETKLILAIAHNNRGDAYVTKREYDRAIQDYDLSIQLNPTFSK